MKRLMGKSFYNMYQYPEFAKAAIILIDGTDKALDYQAAMFVIALETLCTKLKDIYKMIYDRIIKDIGLWTKIRKPVTKSFVEARERYNVDEAFINRISQRIHNLNDISNTDKFKMVIERLGLKTMASDKKVISQRNNLLHGELIEKTSGESTGFDDMYYYSLVLHRLCSAFLFIFAGYNGFLVNNAVIMDRKVTCERKEPVLLEI